MTSTNEVLGPVAELAARRREKDLTTDLLGHYARFTPAELSFEVVERCCHGGKTPR